MARRTWYRLDNIGKFYSSQAGRSSQTVFRYSAELEDDIAPDILQHALDHAIAQFPSFNVHLLNGMFWHYLEQSDGRPLVEPEHLPICSRLHYGPKSMLFRVSYFRNRVNLEVSHIISDGRGAINLFKSLLHAYIAERYDVPGVLRITTVRIATKPKTASTNTTRKTRPVPRPARRSTGCPALSTGTRPRSWNIMSAPARCLVQHISAE